MDDLRLTDVLTRLGALENAVGLNNERLASLTGRLDREVLRRVELSELHHQDQDRRIDVLEAYRDETRGAINLVRFAVGSSLIAAIVTTITLIALITGSHP